MAKILHGKKEAKRGQRVTRAAGWRLVATKGVLRYWVASLQKKIDVGDEQILIFRIRRN